MKTGHKLILGFAGVTLLTTAVVYTSMRASRKELQEAIGRSSVAFAAQMLGRIDRSIHGRIESFQAYSRVPLLQRVIAASHKDFAGLGDVRAHIQAKDQEWCSTPKGEMTPLMRGIIGNELSEALRKRIGFYEDKYGYRVFGEVFVTNKYGANVAQTGRTSDYYQADEQWWHNARKDRVYVADVQYDESAGVYSTDLCIRIDDEAGKFAGAMKVVLNIREVIELLKAEEREGRQFKLLTRDNRVVYATEEHQFLGELPPALVARLRSGGTDHYSAAAPRTRSGSYHVGAGDMPGEGEELFACARSQGHADFPGLGWMLVVERETDDVLAPIARLHWKVVGALAAAVVLVIVLALFISRSISRPIAGLCAAAVRIGEGRLATRVDIEGSGELRVLERTFNKMAASLAATTTSVEKLNKEVAERKHAEERLGQVHAELREQVVQLTQAREATLNMMEDAARAEARNAELLLRQQVLLENAPAAVFLKDIEGRYTVVNRGCVELLPTHVEDPVGKRDRDLYPESLAAKLERENRLVMKQGRTIEKEERIRLRSGRVADMAVTLAPVRIEGGTIVGMVGLAADITERKRVHKEIEELKRQIEFILGATNTGVDIIDAEFNIRYIDPEWRKVYGDPAGRKCYEYFMDRDDVCPGCGVVKALRTKETAVTEEVLVKEGNRPIQVTTRPFQDEHGEWLVAEVNVDITERKRAEAELEKYAEEMERLNRSLEQSNQNLRDFTYAVSHDLQEPLRKVHAFADFLVEDCGDHIPDAGKEHLRRMQNATVRMKGLIHHLLELSRVDTRGSDLAPTDPAEVIADVLETLGERVREYDAEIEVQSELPRVLADATQLGQVFQNLIGNALKFRAPERKPRIRITAEQTGGEVAFSVADNGIGMEGRFLEKIFAVFQRLHTRDEYEGTGVGLALCRRITERHGGRIWAEAEPGKGSTFRFTVRRAPQHKEEEDDDGSRTEAVGAGAARRG